MALGTVGLKTAVWNNNLRSVALIALYPFLIAGMIWVIAALWGASMASGGTAGGLGVLAQMNGHDGAPGIGGNGETLSVAIDTGNAAIAAYWPVIFGVVGCWFLIAALFHTQMIRSMSHAHPVTREQEPALYNLLENLCIARGMTMPRLEIIETSARNAFASGIDDKSYTITVTRGLMQALTDEEMEAVLGHELTHIVNHDVRLLIISIIFTGMVGFIAQTFWSNMRIAMMRRSRGRNNAGALLFLLAIGAVLWLGYMATMLTRFAISRRREFMADAGAIELTKKPEAMMSALLRIAGADRIPDVPDDIALMCIENGHRFMGLFATHPPITARIKAISEQTGTPIPATVPGSRAAANDGRPAPDPDTRRNPWQ